MRDDVLLALDLERTKVYERMGDGSGRFIARISVTQAKALRKQIDKEIENAQEYERTPEERLDALEDTDAD